MPLDCATLLYNFSPDFYVYVYGCCIFVCNNISSNTMGWTLLFSYNTFFPIISCYLVRQRKSAFRNYLNPILKSNFSIIRIGDKASAFCCWSDYRYILYVCTCTRLVHRYINRKHTSKILTLPWRLTKHISLIFMSCVLCVLKPLSHSGESLN